MSVLCQLGKEGIFLHVESKEARLNSRQDRLDRMCRPGAAGSQPCESCTRSKAAHVQDGKRYEAIHEVDAQCLHALLWWLSL